MTTYVLAGGCFWCIDAALTQLRGVTSLACGYTGGEEGDANYERVSTGKTNHAEAVRISFDEIVIPREIILDIFFLIHDPTSLNQQGADRGTQYRSAMFPADKQQETDFRAAIERSRQLWTEPIVTTLEPLTTFYEAEDEHQQYFDRHPDSLYCSTVIAPKVSTARAHYSTWLKRSA